MDMTYNRSPDGRREFAMEAAPLIPLSVPGRGVKAAVGRAVLPAVAGPLGFHFINDLHAGCADAQTPQEYLRRILETLRVHWTVPAEALKRIPRSGPLIVVANHPMGAIEGLALASLLLQVRPDAKLLVNYLLMRIPNLAPIFLSVDPFEGSDSTARSTAGMRASVRHLREGGVLGLFPAGEVAHPHGLRLKSEEQPWKPFVAKLVRMTDAQVLPVYFDGTNSRLSQLAGAVHPRLRTALLAREVRNKRHSRIGIAIGQPIAHRRLEQVESDEKMTSFLRQRTLLLTHRPQESRKPHVHQKLRSLAKQRRHNALLKAYEPIVPAVDANVMTEELSRLPSDQLLASSGPFDVFVARAHQIPAVLREIGRLREITFRATGEGTGKSIDLDAFDEHYLHLFTWNRTQQEVVGAYRLGLSDEVLSKHGLSGLYTRTLFEYDHRLIDRLNPAIELGRSFIRAEYQKNYRSLLMLWQGIGQFVGRNPQYRYLFGPVSISNDYQTVSRSMMVQFLRVLHSSRELAGLVLPRNPMRAKPIRNFEHDLFSSDDLSDLVSDIEPDHKGMPVLVRHYLKLGAKMLAFNVDPDFGNCVDGLIVVDLADPAIPVDRYFGPELLKKFRDHDAAPVAG